MSEEVIFVFGVILAAGALWYLLLGASVTGSKLSASDIRGYASNAGFFGDDLVTAIAIALAESGGDPNAKGDKVTGMKATTTLPAGTPTSYGLWQVHWTVHPEVLNGADPSILFDPQKNAQAAMIVFQEQGWNAWSTYGNLPGHNNAYASYVDQAEQAVNA